MKILVFNQDWFVEELRELGHEVVMCGTEAHMENRIPFMTNTLSAVLTQIGNFSPDAILWHDNSLPTFLLAGLESTHIPIVFFSVDTFHHESMHAFMAPIFDHVLVAQKDYVKVFDDSGTPATWLPLWAPRYVDASDEKQWAATFVGNLNPRLNPRRVAFFEALKEIIPIHIAQGNYWEFFPFADIVVNQTVKGDLNFRTFEAMMSGALLLTERTPNGLLEIFREGEHLVTYSPDNVREAAEKVTYLLQNPEQMRAVARAGREEILRNHTAKSRAKTVHEILSAVKKRTPAIDRNFRAMVNHAMSNLVTKRHTQHHSPYSLAACLTAAQNGLNEGEPLSDTQASYLVRASYAYDEATQTNLGEQLIAHFAMRMPKSPIVALTCIRNLLNSGRRLEAEVLASRMSDQAPSEIFNCAEQAVQSILDAVN